MRLTGLSSQARISGIAAALHGLAGDDCGCKGCGEKRGLSGLSGTNAGVVYGKMGQQVAEVLAAPIPSPTGARPPDALMFSDSHGYLRIVLNNADWDGVARWYATQIQELAKTTLNPKAYWGLSALNVQNYCDRTLTLGDLHAFTEKCIFKMCVADYGNKVGFGYVGRMDNVNLAMFFDNGLSHSSGQLNWFTSYANAKAGTRYGFCIGWVKEPAKHTASKILVAVGAAFIGAAAFSALSAGASTAGTAAGAAEGAGAGAGAGTGAGAGIASAGSAIPAGIEVVTTTASAIAPAVTAGSVAAGLSAGAVAIAAAPPPLSPPNVPVEPVIETVTTTASAIAPAAVDAASVAAGLAAGAVVASVAPPAIVTQTTLPDSVIEEVTTEAQAIKPPDPINVGAAIEAGAVIASLTPPSITAPEINVPEPELNETEGNWDTIRDRLLDLIKNIGGELAGNRLRDWLTDQLGRPPTDQELDDYRNLIEDPTYEPWQVKLKKALPFVLLVLVLLAAVLRKRKKQGAKRVRP